MPTQLLGIGPAYTISQNVVYALPARLCQISYTVACDVSVDGSVWSALTNNSINAANFIRCTTGSSVVVCKAADKI